MARRQKNPKLLPWPGEILLELEAYARVMIDKHRCDVGPIEKKHRCQEWESVAHWLKRTSKRFTRALKMEKSDPQGLDKMAERLRKQIGVQAFSWMEGLV